MSERNLLSKFSEKTLALDDCFLLLFLSRELSELIESIE